VLVTTWGRERDEGEATGARQARGRGARVPRGPTGPGSCCAAQPPFPDVAASIKLPPPSLTAMQNRKMPNAKPFDTFRRSPMSVMPLSGGGGGVR
jgi:hypothetical protein